MQICYNRAMSMKRRVHNSHISIFFVSGRRGSGARSLKLSRKLFNGLIVLGSLGIITSLLGWFGVAEMGMAWHWQKENTDLVKTNDMYKEEIARLQSMIDDVKIKSDRMVTLLGLENSSGYGGVGGLEFQYELLNPAYEDIHWLVEDTQRVKDQLDWMSEYVESEQSRWQKIPLSWPARGVVMHGFGYRDDPFTGERRFHHGMDIASPRGTTVRATANGVVKMAERNGGLGKCVTITHSDGIETRYGHLYEYNVAKGELIKRGQVIGFVGTTGRSTGYHVHYEVLKDGERVNPKDYILELNNSFHE